MSVFDTVGTATKKVWEGISSSSTGLQFLVYSHQSFVSDQVRDSLASVCRVRVSLLV